jgi:hypothetical protein
VSDSILQFSDVFYTNEIKDGFYEALLWTNTELDKVEDGETFNIHNLTIDPSVRIQCDEFVNNFVAYCQTNLKANSNGVILECLHYHQETTDSSYMGHDLMLTCAGHGCGFWDGDWEESENLKIVMNWCETHRIEGSLYIGDDGIVYMC